jgi:hypothetical protein
MSGEISGSTVTGGGTTTYNGLVGLSEVTLTGASNTLLYIGSDTITLGSGAASISAGSGSSSDHAVIVSDPSLPTETFFGFGVVFNNGDGSSTITAGGAGDVAAFGNGGGGIYYGGSDNGNFIGDTAPFGAGSTGKTGAMTIFGGGGGISYDGLYGAGSGGQDLIYSGTGLSTTYARGSDTLVGSDTLTSGTTGDQFYTAASTRPGVSNTGTIVLGAGVDTIVANGAESENVIATSVSGGVLFWGGTTASTVAGYDSGTNTINAGTGGGVFYSGTGTGNLLYGNPNSGASAVTLYGGGGSDTLIGANAQHNLFVASNGNETLYGGQGNDTFNFESESVVAGGGTPHAATYTLYNLSTTDTFLFNPNQIASQGVVGGSYTISLVDGSKIVLAGVTDPGRTFT